MNHKMLGISFADWCWHYFASIQQLPTNLFYNGRRGSEIDPSGKKTLERIDHFHKYFDLFKAGDEQF